MINIINEIKKKRKLYRSQESREIRNAFPENVRSLPLVDFFSEKDVICELKKASPSKGVINNSDEFTDIIDDYLAGGASRFSVLTERNYFLGDWRYLHVLKSRHPEMGFLRKDFLFCREDIHDAWLMGADAVLLIAAMLKDRELEELIAEAHTYGLKVLCEAHTDLEVERIVNLREKTDALGINARDLKTFRVNTRMPFALKRMVPDNLPVIFESGAADSSVSYLAGNSGFSGILIGEAVMRSSGSERTDLVYSLRESFFGGDKAQPVFFTKLMRQYAGRPLVKICGITNIPDALAAVQAGTDVLGFILAPSRRQVSPAGLSTFKNMPVLKAAVVMDPDEDMQNLLRDMLEKGVIDAVQFHGQESPELVKSFLGNGYKALIPLKPADVLADPYAPLSLYDRPKGKDNDSLGIPFGIEFSDVLRGTFLAGGITPVNLESVLKTFDPLLVDIAGGVEKEPGIKDYERINEIFSIIRKNYG